MPSYIAMLRGINVSGRNLIKMADLRAAFGALKFSNIATYVQSGNVIFEATNDSAAVLSKAIEQKIERNFGFSVPVFLRTTNEMAAIVRRNPFLKEAGIDHSKLHVTFLSEPAPKTAEESLEVLAVNREQFRIKGREIYLYCPNGYGKTKLSNGAIEKKLHAVATTRNWKSVSALVVIAQGLPA